MRDVFLCLESVVLTSWNVIISKWIKLMYSNFSSSSICSVLSQTENCLIKLQTKVKILIRSALDRSLPTSEICTKKASNWTYSFCVGWAAKNRYHNYLKSILYLPKFFFSFSVCITRNFGPIIQLWIHIHKKLRTLITIFKYVQLFLIEFSPFSCARDMQTIQTNQQQIGISK